MHIRPDLEPWYEIKTMLLDAGAVQNNYEDAEPGVRPDGSVKGPDGEYGPPSELRAYTPGEEGSYTATDLLRSGRYDKLIVKEDKYGRKRMDKDPEWA